MVEYEYNMILVVLSYVIAVFGSYTALNLAIRIPTATGASLFGWLTMAAIALGGGGIWSMHFIGMLAFETKMPVSYDLVLTAASMILAIVVCGIGLLIVGRGTSGVVKLLLGGLITGLGVAGMHYTGMAAMILPAKISYNMPIFYASLVIAVIAATAALWLAFNLRGTLQRFGSAFVMGTAVCGMHYTGMAALRLTPTGEAIAKASSSSFIFATYIFIGATLVLAVLHIITLAKASKVREQAFGT